MSNGLTSLGHSRSVPVQIMLVGPFLAIYGGGCCTLRATTLALASKLAVNEPQR